MSTGVPQKFGHTNLFTAFQEKLSSLGISNTGYDIIFHFLYLVY